MTTVRHLWTSCCQLLFILSITSVACAQDASPQTPLAADREELHSLQAEESELQQQLQIAPEYEIACWVANLPLAGFRKSLQRVEPQLRDRTASQQLLVGCLPLALATTDFQILSDAALSTSGATPLVDSHTVVRPFVEANQFVGGQFPVTLSGRGEKKVDWQIYGRLLQANIHPLGGDRLQLTALAEISERNLNAAKVPAGASPAMTKISSVFNLPLECGQTAISTILLSPEGKSAQLRIFAFTPIRLDSVRTDGESTSAPLQGEEATAAALAKLRRLQEQSEALRNQIREAESKVSQSRLWQIGIRVFELSPAMKTPSRHPEIAAWQAIFSAKTPQREVEYAAGWRFVPEHFNQFLTEQITQKTIKILAEPTMITTDGRPVKVSNGDQLSYFEQAEGEDPIERVLPHSQQLILTLRQIAPERIHLTGGMNLSSQIEKPKSLFSKAELPELVMNRMSFELELVPGTTQIAAVQNFASGKESMIRVCAITCGVPSDSAARRPLSGKTLYTPR